MKSHVKAVVIGGGVVGCSVLYHLARAGWTDIMLIERSELTSGSSWHAAGGFHTLNGDPNVAKLQAYTVQLYKELEELSGQSCSLHLTGGVMLADSPERMDFLRLAHAKGRYLGMDTELITPSEAKAMFPFMDESHFVGAMWDPVEGHLDPSGTTHAYAKSAQKLGAEIVLRNPVKELTQDPDGTWNVITEKGTVKAEHIVNCGGLWAREIGRLLNELKRAQKRGVYMVAFSHAKLPKMPGEVFSYGLDESALESFWRHRMIVVADDRTTLIGATEDRPTDSAVISETAAIAEVATSQVALDITLLTRRDGRDVRDVMARMLGDRVGRLDSLLEAQQSG